MKNRRKRLFNADTVGKGSFVKVNWTRNMNVIKAISNTRNQEAV